MLTFKGQEALDLRFSAADKDQAGRRKLIEDEVKTWLPAGAKVDLEKAGNWGASEEPLVAECRLQFANLADLTGRRILFPPAVFQADRKHPLQHARRAHPVYFDHPYQTVDQVTIELPAGFQVESLPPAHRDAPVFAHFESALGKAGHAVELKRRFAMEGIFFRTEYYQALRDFFDKVRASDEEKVVVVRIPETAPRD